MAQGNKYFVYYNFLFYLFLIPFTYLTPLYVGVKLYAVFAAAGVFTIFYWCCRKLGIRYPLLWTAGIISITSTGSFWRFFLSRPYVLSPALLMLILVCAYKKKHWWIFVLSFVYLFWHSATFYMPLGIVFVHFIFEKFYGEKGSNKNILAALAGTLVAVGTVFSINSGFLFYMRDIIFGIFTDTIVGKKVILPEGNEVHPVDFFDLLRINFIACAFIVVAGTIEILGYIRHRFHQEKDDTDVSIKIVRSSLFFITISFFLGATLLSRRFNDYLVLFAGLYVALSFTDLFSYIEFKKSFVKRGVLIGLSISVFYMFAANIIFLQQLFSNGAHPLEFEKTGLWLRDNTEKGDIVFNLNWGWFTNLYYYSPDNNFVTGLEPRFIYTYNPRLYWLWAHIASQGYVCAVEKCPEKDAEQRLAFKKNDTAVAWYKKEGRAIADVLQKDFSSRYIVSGKDYRQLNILLDNNKEIFNNVSRDTVFGYLVYKIEPAKK